MSYFTQHVKIGPYEVRAGTPLDSVINATRGYSKLDEIISHQDRVGTYRTDPSRVPYIKRAPKVTFFDGEYGNPSNLYEWKMALRAARFASRAARFNPWLNAIDIGMTVWQHTSMVPAAEGHWDFAGVMEDLQNQGFPTWHKGPCNGSGMNSVQRGGSGLVEYNSACLGGQVPDGANNGTWKLEPGKAVSVSTNSGLHFGVWTMLSSAVGMSARGFLQEGFAAQWKYATSTRLPNPIVFPYVQEKAKVNFPDPFGGTDFKPRPFSRSVVTEAGSLPSNYIRPDLRPDYGTKIAVQYETQPQFAGGPPSGPREVVHEIRPPTKGEKEHKINTSAGVVKVIMDVLGQVDEANQIIDALYKALPNKVVWFKGRDGKWHMRHFGPLEKAAAVYRNLHQLNWEKAFINLASNHLQDKALGAFGNAMKKSLRRAAQAGYYRGAQGLQGGGYLRNF